MNHINQVIIFCILVFAMLTYIHYYYCMISLLSCSSYHHCSSCYHNVSLVVHHSIIGCHHSTIVLSIINISTDMIYVYYIYIYHCFLRQCCSRPTSLPAFLSSSINQHHHHCKLPVAIIMSQQPIILHTTVDCQLFAPIHP